MSWKGYPPSIAIDPGYLSVRTWEITPVLAPTTVSMATRSRFAIWPSCPLSRGGHKETNSSAKRSSIAFDVGICRKPLQKLTKNFSGLFPVEGLPRKSRAARFAEGWSFKLTSAIHSSSRSVQVQAEPLP